MASNSIKIYNDTVLKQSVLQGYQVQRTNQNLGKFTMGELAFTRDTGRLFVGNYTTNTSKEDSKPVSGGMLVGNKYLGFIDSKPLIHFSSSGSTGWKPLSYQVDTTDELTNTTEHALFGENSRFRQDDSNGWNKKAQFIEKYGVYSGDFTFDIYNNALILFDKNITTKQSEQPIRKFTVGENNVKTETFYDKTNNQIPLEKQKRRTPLYDNSQSGNSQYPIYGDGYVVMRIVQPDGQTLTFKDRTFKQDGESQDGKPLTSDSNWSHNFMTIKHVPATILQSSFSDQFILNDTQSKLKLNPVLTGIQYLNSNSLILPHKVAFGATETVQNQETKYNCTWLNFHYPQNIQTAQPTDKIIALTENGENSYHATIAQQYKPSYIVKLKDGLYNPITNQRQLTITTEASSRGELALGFVANEENKINYQTSNPFNIITQSSYYYSGTAIYDASGSLTAIEKYDDVYADNAKDFINKFDTNYNAGLNLLKQPVAICWNVPQKLQTDERTTFTNLDFLISPYLFCIKKEYTSCDYSSENLENVDKFKFDTCVSGNNTISSSQQASRISIIDGFSFNINDQQYYENKIVNNSNRTIQSCIQNTDFVITNDAIDETQVEVYINQDGYQVYNYIPNNPITFYIKDGVFYIRNKVDNSYNIYEGVQITEEWYEKVPQQSVYENIDGYEVYEYIGNNQQVIQKLNDYNTIYSKEGTFYYIVNNEYKTSYEPFTDTITISNEQIVSYMNQDGYEVCKYVGEQQQIIQALGIVFELFIKDGKFYTSYISTTDDTKRIYEQYTGQISLEQYEKVPQYIAQIIQGNEGININPSDLSLPYNLTKENFNTQNGMNWGPNQGYEDYSVLVSLRRQDFKKFVQYQAGLNSIWLSNISKQQSIKKIQVSTNTSQGRFVTLFDAEIAEQYTMGNFYHPNVQSTKLQTEQKENQPSNTIEELTTVVTIQDALGVINYQCLLNAPIFTRNDYAPYVLKITTSFIDDQGQQMQLIKYVNLSTDMIYTDILTLPYVQEEQEEIDESLKEQGWQEIEEQKAPTPKLVILRQQSEYNTLLTEKEEIQEYVLDHDIIKGSKKINLKKVAQDSSIKGLCYITYVEKEDQFMTNKPIQYNNSNELYEWDQYFGMTDNFSQQQSYTVTFRGTGVTKYKIDENDETEPYNENYIISKVVTPLLNENNEELTQETYLWSDEHGRQQILTLLQQNKIYVPNSTIVTSYVPNYTMVSLKETPSHDNGYNFPQKQPSKTVIIPNHAQSVILQVHRQTAGNNLSIYTAKDLKSLNDQQMIEKTVETTTPDGEIITETITELIQKNNQQYSFPFDIINDEEIPSLKQQTCMNKNVKLLYSSSESGCQTIEVPLYKTSINQIKGFSLRLSNLKCGNTPDKFLIRVIGYRV